MGYSKKRPTLQMVLLESLNARLFLEIHSCINSLFQIRQERIGIIHTMVILDFNPSS